MEIELIKYCLKYLKKKRIKVLTNFDTSFIIHILNKDQKHATHIPL